MNLIANIALSDTGFVFNPSTGDSFSVNPIGLSVLKDLKDNKSITEIHNRILTEFNTDEATVEKDLYDFIAMLKQMQLAK